MEITKDSVKKFSGMFLMFSVLMLTIAVFFYFNKNVPNFDISVTNYLAYEFTEESIGDHLNAGECLGDFNTDGAVNLLDVNMLREIYNPNLDEINYRLINEKRFIDIDGDFYWTNSDQQIFDENLASFINKNKCKFYRMSTIEL